jgi:hypothetical protein
MKHRCAMIEYAVDQASSVLVSVVSSSGFEAAVFANSVRGLTGFLYSCSYQQFILM